MNDPAQAHAYAHADFSEPHRRFVELFKQTFPDLTHPHHVLDLGCGPADVTIRFARAFPDCSIDGVDGAEHMLHHGAYFVGRAGLTQRIHLVHAQLQNVTLPHRNYDAIISNSLLHHLHDPQVLWSAIAAHARPGTAVFVMDLMRPDNPTQAQEFVKVFAAREPELLQRDFYNSLCSAFTRDEVRDQLHKAELQNMSVHLASDLHLIVSGIIK